MSMRTGEFWDEHAPYGVNGYEHFTGEAVRGTVVREVVADMTDRQCAVRGVSEMSDGRVYIFTILRPEFAREKGERTRVRFAHLSRQSYVDTVFGLLKSEADGKRL